MSAADLRTYLRNEYGIMNDDDFEIAVNASAGIDIGLFTQPFRGETSNDKETERIPA